MSFAGATGNARVGINSAITPTNVSPPPGQAYHFWPYFSAREGGRGGGRESYPYEQREGEGELRRTRLPVIALVSARNPDAPLFSRKLLAKYVKGTPARLGSRRVRIPPSLPPPPSRGLFTLLCTRRAHSATANRSPRRGMIRIRREIRELYHVSGIDREPTVIIYLPPLPPPSPTPPSPPVAP